MKELSMLILELMFQYHPYRKKFVTIWPVTREGGRCIKLVTNGDKGGRVKKTFLAVTSFLNGPYQTRINYSLII